MCMLNVEPDCYRELMTPTLARHIVNEMICLFCVQAFS